MEPHDTSSGSQSGVAANPAANISIAQLVGKVYDDAGTTERRKILACLLHPLGVLAIFGVANGVFARILFRHGLGNENDRLADIGEVRASDVTALVDYVQQLGTDSLDGLSQILATSPLMACSGAVVLLLTALLQSARSRKAGVAPSVAPSLASARGESATPQVADTTRPPNA